MKLYASEDEVYQICTGREIVAAYPEIYKLQVIQDIRQDLARRAQLRPDLAGDRSTDDLFAIATYDYWQYGIATAEEFYYGLLGATDEKKRKYITFRGRFDYIDYLNKKEDMHLLRNKWHAYQLLKDAYRREVLLLEGEQDYPAFEAFCHRHPTFVVKPVGLGQSLGVHKVEVGNADLHALYGQLFTEVEETNSLWNCGIDKGVLVEELIEQGEEMFIPPVSTVCGLLQSILVMEIFACGIPSPALVLVVILSVRERPAVSRRASICVLVWLIRLALTSLGKTLLKYTQTPIYLLRASGFPVGGNSARRPSNWPSVYPLCATSAGISRMIRTRSG